MNYQCRKCKKELSEYDAYEYRGAITCENCFDSVCAQRDYERQQIIEIERTKTEVFRNLDLSPDNPIGRANRQILKRHREIASKESERLKKYEGRNK